MTEPASLWWDTSPNMPWEIHSWCMLHKMVDLLSNWGCSGPRCNPLVTQATINPYGIVLITIIIELLLLLLCCCVIQESVHWRRCCVISFDCWQQGQLELAMCYKGALSDLPQSVHWRILQPRGEIVWERWSSCDQGCTSQLIWILGERVASHFLLSYFLPPGLWGQTWWSVSGDHWWTCQKGGISSLCWPKGEQ